MTTPEKIIIVEDDLNLGFLLLDFLEAEGYRVKLCRDGQMGLKALQKEIYDLCILDVMMPEMDGFAFAGQLKSQGHQLPFLFLTARSMKEDRLKGYALGAEDYIAKPFDEDELLCKIEVILRHTTDPTAAACPEQFSLGSYYFDYSRQELHFEGQCQRITQKENEVLRLLCLNKGQILRREEAVEQIYGKKDYFLGRSFDVFISRLRKLLRNDPKISIENVFPVGFILEVKE